MTKGQLINLVFVILGLSGCFYALYSVFIKTIRKEIKNMENNILTKINRNLNTHNANNR